MNKFLLDTRASWLCAAFLTLLSGCSAMCTGQHAFIEGWREGRVVQLGHAEDVTGPVYRDCRQGLTATQLADLRFAAVSYHYQRSRRTVVPPVSPDSTLQIGTAVYAQITTCVPPERIAEHAVN